MLDRIHIFISLISAMIVAVLSIVNDIDFLETTIRLIFVIIISYIIGLIVRSYLVNKVFYEEKDIDEPIINDENVLEASEIQDEEMDFEDDQIFGDDLNG